MTVTTHVNSQILSTAALEGKHEKFANLSEHDDWLIDEILSWGKEKGWLVVFSKVILLILIIGFDSSYEKVWTPY